MAGGSRAPRKAGATPKRQKRKAPDSSPAAAAAAGGEMDEEELEREVSDLGQFILERRRDAATHLDAAISSFAAFRPLPTCLEALTEVQSSTGTSLAEAEKLKILKSKAEANIATIPKVLKKLNECIVRMEKLEQLNVNIHPVFQIRR